MGQGSTGYLILKNSEKLKKELELELRKYSQCKLSLQFEMNKTFNLNLTSLTYLMLKTQFEWEMLNESNSAWDSLSFQTAN